MNQLNFLPTDDAEKEDSIVSMVEEKCRDSALRCAQILIEMAIGERETNKELRLACCDVLNIAYRTKFRSSGRPKTHQGNADNDDKAMYANLMKTLQ